MFEEERKKSTFRKEELSNVIYQGSEKVKEFIYRQKVMENDPKLRFDPATIHRSRSEIMKIYAEKLI